ncbi:MAG: O-methyltransferase [Solirubrobacterales bacterium]
MRLSLRERFEIAAREVVGFAPGPRVGAAQAEHSMIFSAQDDVGPSPRLLDLALAAASHARETPLVGLADRIDKGVRYPEVWPGEHYRLLAGLVRATQAKSVIEIGTATGLSSLAMLDAMSARGGLVTFDIIDWRDYPGHVLTDEDFEDGRLMQILDDVSDPMVSSKYVELFGDVDLVFLDAKKDGLQELAILRFLDSLDFRNAPVLVLDDIRVWKMLSVWRGIQRPKFDVTSLGHWSGTGLVDYSAES